VICSFASRTIAGYALVGGSIVSLTAAGVLVLQENAPLGEFWDILMMISGPMCLIGLGLLWLARLGPLFNRGATSGGLSGSFQDILHRRVHIGKLLGLILTLFLLILEIHPPQAWRVAIQVGALGLILISAAYVTRHVWAPLLLVLGYTAGMLERSHWLTALLNAAALQKLVPPFWLVSLLLWVAQVGLTTGGLVIMVRGVFSQSEARVKNTYRG
jgi:hypothetical protein